MSTPSPTSQRPLSASAVRRILDSLEDLTQGNAKMARAICDLLDDDGKTTIDAVLATITSDNKGEYLRKFKTRFNREAGGALTVVFDRRRGPDLYFTGTDPIAKDIAEYSEHQTYRHASSEQMIDAYAVEEKDPRSDERPDLRIYLSFLKEDGERAVSCADLLERTIKVGLKDRYHVSFFRPDRVLTGEVIDETLKDRIGEADLAIVLVSYAYLDEGIEAQRVRDEHEHPIIVPLENISPSASFGRFDRHDIVSGPSFDEALDSRHPTRSPRAQEIANSVTNLVERGLAKDQILPPMPSASELSSDVLAEELWAHAEQRHISSETISTRALTGEFDTTRADDVPTYSDRTADTPNVVERLTEWARGSDGENSRLCALLGDLGTGKTTSAILLTRRLLELRKTGEQVPLPIYFDLRDLSPTGLTDFGLRTLFTRLLSVSTKSAVMVDDMLDAIRSEPTLVVFDGLDEVLVHLSPGDGQRLTRSLLEVLTLSGPGTETEPPPTRLLLSCRTQYFRTVKEEFAFFDGQGRERVRGKDYLVLTLLSFDEDQIREYLRRNIPDSDPDRLLEMIRSVHDLRALASQPVMLDMIRQILPAIEEDLRAVRRVRSVDLYERFVDQWLSRDDGKHSLIPEHKIQLMTHLAWQVWRSGSRTWSAHWMEEWMLQFLHTHPDMELHYAGRMPDQWKQDFRTATFLARRGDDFSFAHSSLLEYFLAVRLADSLEAESGDEALAAWDITRPSDECFAFFAELIDRLSAPTQRRALTRLEHVGTHASASARANVFAYTLHALEKDAPHPRPDALNLANTDLRSWTIGYKTTTLNFAGVSLRSACLDDARIRHARLDRIDATGASMRRTLFEDCTLSDANLEDADLAGTVFRHCDLDGASLDEARRYRTQLLHTSGFQQKLPDILTAPPTEDTPLRVLPEAQILGGHSKYVTTVTWSPDGTHILTGSGDGTARIWDTTTGDNTLTLTINSVINAIAWSPDGRHILTGGDGTAHIWDATTGDNTLTLTHTLIPAHWVTAVAWSPDGRHILTGSSEGTAHIWNATTGDDTLTLTHTNSVTAVAWSPDGRHILTGTRGGTAHIWDSRTGDNTLTLTTNSIIEAIAWSDDGRHILTASQGGTAHIWDATTGDNTLTLTLIHADWVTAVAWSPDGHHILTASEDDTARIWDATTGDNTLTLTLTHVRWVTSAAWSPNGTQILTASRSGTARIWDPTTGDNTLTLTLAPKDRITSVAWSPDGTQILTASRSGTARIWDATTGDNTLTLTQTDWVRAVAWSPDGTQILTASRSGIAQVWDATTGDNTLIRVSWVTAVAWSPDGHHILTASIDGTARIWDATTGDNTLTLTHADKDGLTSVAWSPDGTQILTGCQDGTAHIWDATTREDTPKPRLTLTHTDWVRAVAWSPDGHHILTASDDGTARIWDATTGEQVRFFIAVLPEDECAVLTPDQTRVIGASPYAWRWLGRYAKHPGGALERIPVEIDGPLPSLSHGTATE